MCVNKCIFLNKPYQKAFKSQNSTDLWLCIKYPGQKKSTIFLLCTSIKSKFFHHNFQDNSYKSSSLLPDTSIMHVGVPYTSLYQWQKLYSKVINSLVLGDYNFKYQAHITGDKLNLYVYKLKSSKYLQLWHSLNIVKVKSSFTIH